MAYRRRYRSRARTYRRFRRSKFNRQRRFANMQFNAMLAQRDIARFCLKYRYPLTLDVTQNKQFASGALGMWNVLHESPQYEAYSRLFDQVKINAVKVKMIPTWQVAQADTARMSQVVAWDRNGVADGTKKPGYQEICTYGSSIKQVASPFSKNVFNTMICAEDVIERSTYVDTLDLPLGIQQSYTYSMFRPVLLYGVATPVAVPSGATQTYNWELEIAFDLTFRGVRSDDKVAN